MATHFLMGGSLICIYAKKLNIRRFHLMVLLIMGSTETFSPVKCNQYFAGAMSPRYFSGVSRLFMEKGIIHQVGKINRTYLFALTPKYRDLYEKIIKSMRRFMKKHYYGIHSWEKI